MKYFTIPKTEEKVSRIILGCWAFAGGSDWGDQDEKTSIRTIHAALDIGINALDTAIGYGNGVSEKVVGKAVKDRRDRVLIYDKIPTGHLRYEDVLSSADSILKNLNMDYVDVMQIHWGDRDVPIEETLGAMEKLKEEGKIRHFGVCNFGPELLKETLSIMPPLSNQLSYSLLSRGIEYRVQPSCGDNNIGILAYSPLQQGLLTGKYLKADDFPAGRARTRHFSGSREGVRHGGAGFEKETFAAIRGIKDLCEKRDLVMTDVCLAWVLSRPSLAAVICGARNEKQIEENVKALNLTLDDDFLVSLTLLTDDLKEKMGDNGDLWNQVSRIW